MKVAISINNKFCCVTFSVKIGFVEEAASYNINTTLNQPIMQSLLFSF